MARMGMDDVAVEGIGKELQKFGEQIEALSSQINSRVQRLPGIWEGKDSNEFVQHWWPQHQKSLKAAAEAVKGLGNSALNNVNEQRNVSGH